MIVSIEKTIHRLAHGDGGETLNQRYDLRLYSLMHELRIWFPNIIQKSTHKEHSNKVYKLFAKEYEVKLSDVKRMAEVARELNSDELIKR